MNQHTLTALVFMCVILATLAVFLLPRDTLALATFMIGAAAAFNYLSEQENQNE